MADDKKRVLYLSRRADHNPLVSDVLGGSYDLEQYVCETIEELPDILRKPLAGRKYDAVITCVPHTLITFSYANSLKAILHARQQNPKLPMIAYTSAGPIDAVNFAACKSIDAIVVNKGELHRLGDAEEIKQKLDEVFSRGEMHG